MTEGSGTHRKGLKVVKEAVSEDVKGDSLVKNAFPKGNGESTVAQDPGLSRPQQPKSRGRQPGETGKIREAGSGPSAAPRYVHSPRTVASHPHSAITSFNTTEPRQYSTQAPKLKGHR